MDFWSIVEWILFGVLFLDLFCVWLISVLIIERRIQLLRQARDLSSADLAEEDVRGGK